MKFTKQDLLTLLIGLFLFASCKDSNTIGLDLDPDYAIKGTLMDSATVTSQTLKDEVASGVGLVRHPLGVMVDPVFGKSEAAVAMAVGLPSTGYKFGTNAVIDSAVLVLPYSTQLYGDTIVPVYTVKVNQLTNDISKETSYPTDKDWPAAATVLGTFSGKIKPNTKLKIYDIVAGAADTLKTVVPQMRIKLDNSFIQNNIINLDSVTLSKQANFFKAFKGLHLTATTTDKGGIVFFNLSGTDGKIEVYYKRQNATTTTATDTVATSFPIGTATGPVTATIKHDYTGTPVKTQLDVPNPATPYAITYLQALGGLRNKISFPYLKNFVANAKKPENGGNPNTKIIINKAELVIDLNDGTDVFPFSAAQRLSLYRLDIASQRANIPDNDNAIQGQYAGDPRALGSEVLFGGYFDSVRKRYLFTVTSYIQDLMDGKTEDYGTFLAPSSLTEFNISPSVTSAARSVINKFKYPRATGEKSLKLNIYYTQVN
ncbi:MULTISPECIES: DUF4270 domain-containing protein [Pedobacter]|uniref:DUF4270 domain-containing protein n=1 Tax=Pedobacter heparinus (strain ATCC 13125 / DSM 2366 / CIP 104194 / JCM 7457 / NBRC 12017 / NCIMB 9290 / NRRL B-14731 / HIM 762-3) TaxID=485917 RepID=C6XY91_PEDHD|nr:MULTISPECIES: DUF4270 domain-containing protein [Pedobacter]ACU02358.1 hypothetical protein Phep_0132 [Pedobacter heparinus DSM 2366]MBB5437022.1 hypothetical protein [Pedobacter sp. AK017]